MKKSTVFRNNHKYYRTKQHVVVTILDKQIRKLQYLVINIIDKISKQNTIFTNSIKIIL